MKTAAIAIIVCYALTGSPASAGEARELELFDGSVITGEVLSLVKGMYTIKSESLGTIRIEESKIRAIRSRVASSAAPLSGAAGTSADVKTLQSKMAGDPEVMNLIRSLQDDPKFKEMLEDPEILQAVQSGDVAALLGKPKFLELLNNPTVHQIEKKVN